MSNKIFSLIEFCLKTAFALIFIFCLVFVLLNYALVSPMAETGEFSLEYGNFGKNPIWLVKTDYNTINELYASYLAAELTAVEVAYQMYYEILTNLALVKRYSYRSLGTITFSAAGVGGEVLNTQIRSSEHKGTPSLDPNHPTEYYYQNIVTAQNLSAASTIKNIMQSLITKGLREYSDGTNITREMGSKGIFVDQKGGGAVWSGEQETKTLKEDNKDGRQYNDPEELREISNLIINENSILDDSVSIEQKEETDGNGEKHFYYNVKFNLDCSNPTVPGSAVYYEAESIRKQVGESMLKTLAYTEAGLSLKIYDTGYLADWSMSNTWNAVFKVAFLELDGSASMQSRQVLSYSDSDCVINNFVLKAA